MIAKMFRLFSKWMPASASMTNYDAVSDAGGKGGGDSGGYFTPPVRKWRSEFVMLIQGGIRSGVAGG